MISIKTEILWCQVLTTYKFNCFINIFSMSHLNKMSKGHKSSFQRRKTLRPHDCHLHSRKQVKVMSWSNKLFKSTYPIYLIEQCWVSQSNDRCRKLPISFPLFHVWILCTEYFALQTRIILNFKIVLNNKVWNIGS